MKVNNLKKSSVSIICLLSFSLCIIANNTFGSDAKMYIVSKYTMLIFFMLSILKLCCKRTLLVRKIFFIQVLFVFWEFFSCMWAVNQKIAFTQFSTQIQLFILYIFSYFVLDEKDDAKYLYVALYLSGVSLFIYTLITYGFSGYIQMIQNGMRLGGLIANENGYGRVYALAGICSFYYFLSKSTGIIKCIHLAFTGLFLVNILASGSRGAALIIVIGIFLISFFKFGATKIWKFALIMAVLAFVFWNAIQLPQFNMIYNRFLGVVGDHQEASALGRSDMLKEGIQLFFKTPLFGTGLYSFSVLSKFGTYSHNNYIEVLVSLGIVGFLLFYGPLLSVTKKVCSIFHRSRDNTAIMVLAILVIYILVGMITVQLYSKDYWMVLGFATAFGEHYYEEYI